jgi:hypothetical protein
MYCSPLERLKRAALIGALFWAGGVTPAAAVDLRYGAAMGFGGQGLVQVVNGKSVQRSEGPGMLALSLETLLKDYLSLGLDHSRGFRLGPLSSGVSFTGLTGRWYFGPAPSVSRVSEQGATLFVRRFAPYLGLGAGVAFAKITRSNDLVPETENSGMYIGYRAGVDYPLSPGLLARTEVSYATTLQSDGLVNQFAFLVGLSFF